MIRFLLAATPLFSQIAPDQLRTTTEPPTRLLAITESGTSPIEVGPGVEIRKTPTGYAIVATVMPTPPAAITVQSFVLTAATGGGYVTTAQVILRNNLPQVEGVDFKRISGAIVFEKPVAPIDVIVGLKFILQPG